MVAMKSQSRAWRPVPCQLLRSGQSPSLSSRGGLSAGLPLTTQESVSQNQPVSRVSRPCERQGLSAGSSSPLVFRSF